MSMVLDLLGKALGGAAGGATAYGLLWWQTRQEKKALVDGELTNEVLIVTNVIEDIDSIPFLKPRTVRSERPIGEYFANKALAQAIVAATARCQEGDVESQFIVLPDKRSQGKLMKRVVNIASELGAPGHIRRMFKRQFDKNEGFVCINYAQAGEDDWIIRIDIVSQDDLKRFLEPGFVDKLDYRKEEGSHIDNALILQFCAKLHFGVADIEKDPRMYVRRVTIPTAQ
jgi:hypothetical protein